MKISITSRPGYGVLTSTLTLYCLFSMTGLLSMTGTIRAETPFDGDTFSVDHLLGAEIDSIIECFDVHMAGMDDNTVLFDGFSEFLDPYLDGTAPFVFEFETDRKQVTTKGLSGSSFEIHSVGNSGSDLFPEGFEDPETGTPLNLAKFEIGIDDPLDSNVPTDVTSAMITFVRGTSTPIGPLDITSSFSKPWDGRLSLVFHGFVGLDIDQVNLVLETAPAQQEIFSDGFESGDATAWTDQ